MACLEFVLGQEKEKGRRRIEFLVRIRMKSRTGFVALKKIN
jgi:hypothetical protein